MQPEEPPAVLWGLDPLFSAFSRLYVRDMLDMEESTQVPGIYFYNLHPIYKVDVLGTVVYKREREDFFCYGVDDGTGVISCLCWKSDLVREDEAAAAPGAASSDGAPAGFNPASELRTLRRTQRERRRLEIGELLRVRGTLKTSRQQREIMASAYYKVNDPVMALQIAWMMEAPQLYRDCYDKRLPLSDSSSGGALLGASDAVKAFLERERVSRFRPHDVQHLLQPLVCRTPPAHQEPSAGPSAGPPAGPPAGPSAGPSAGPPAGPSAGPSAGPPAGPPAGPSAGPCAGPSAGQQLRDLLKETLQALQDEGVVYRRVKSPDEVYTVTSEDKDLQMVVRDVITEDSRREKYAEKGCHVLHVLSAVRQRFSLNVSRAALEVVLASLECSSDIVSTTDQHYTAF